MTPILYRDEEQLVDKNGMDRSRPYRLAEGEL
jgi:hypothetical protein